MKIIRKKIYILNNEIINSLFFIDNRNSIIIVANEIIIN